MSFLLHELPSRLNAEFIGNRKQIIPFPPDIPFKHIRPNPDKPTVVLPSDFRIGRVESGFGGQPPDVILYINAAGIAGDGPTTQALQVSEGLKHIANSAERPIPIHYVGPHNGESDIAISSYTGSLPPQLFEIPAGATTVPQKYQVIADSLTETIRMLALKGHRKIFAVSTGYTGFVPYGFKEAMRIVNQDGFGMKAILVNQDSSLPDTDNPSSELDPATGYPLDRFYHAGYSSDGNVTVWLLTNQLYEFNIKYARRRAPKGILTAATTFPFTPEYVQRWVDWRNLSKRDACSQLASKVNESQPKLAEALLSNAIFVTLFASNGYFDFHNVGKWMTENQFRDINQGSRTLVESLIETAKHTHKQIILSGVEQFIQLVESFKIPGVQDINEDSSSTGSTTAHLFLAKVPRFIQSEYGIYHRAADIAVHRTTQANTAAETLLAGVPTVFLTMPASGYMDSLKMDRVAYERGLRQYEPTVDPQKLAERFTDIISDPGYAASLVNLSDNLFLQHFKNHGTNFMAVLGHLAGVSYRSLRQ